MIKRENTKTKIQNIFVTPLKLIFKNRKKIFIWCPNLTGQKKFEAQSARISKAPRSKETTSNPSNFPKQLSKQHIQDVRLY